jgi:peptidoglycan/xylan/chitin deacetylase (PgdA/CDA1 family)
MGKRLLLADLLSRAGMGGLSRRVNRNLVFVFNYHRVKPKDGPIDTLFDAGTFGPSPAQLKQQLELLNKYTTVLTERDMIKALQGDKIGKGPYSMVTFDDAYEDNYTLAMPILMEVGVPAIFFVPAMVIEDRNLGWWDKIAYIIKNSPKRTIDFQGEIIELTNRKDNVIHFFHSKMKLNPSAQTVNLLNELVEAFDSPPPSPNLMDKELMSWEQLKKAHNAGISIGSHTSRHLVLSTLNEEEQAKEIVGSKFFIEEKLNIKVRSLAFPFGGLEHFNETSLQLMMKSDYELGFSFNTGIGKLREKSRYSMPRIAAPKDFKTFALTLNFPHLLDYGAKERSKLQRVWHHQNKKGDE